MNKSDAPGYVRYADTNKISVCVDLQDITNELDRMGFKFNKQDKSYDIRVKTDTEIAGIFKKLRDLNFAFTGGPAGWPPASLFEHYREQNYISGQFTEVVWQSPTRRVYRVL